MSGSVYDSPVGNVDIDLEATAVSDNDPVTKENFAFTGVPELFNVNSALGRNGISFFVENNGVGILTVASSRDGVIFGDEKTVQAGNGYGLDNQSVHTIRITKVTDTGYSAVAQ